MCDYIYQFYRRFRHIPTETPTIPTCAAASEKFLIHKNTKYTTMTEILLRKLR